LAENRDFSYTLHLTPPLMGSLSEYYHNIGTGKTGVVWLPEGESLMIRCATLTEYWPVTDGHFEIA